MTYIPYCKRRIQRAPFGGYIGPFIADIYIVEFVRVSQVVTWWYLNESSSSWRLYDCKMQIHRALSCGYIGLFSGYKQLFCCGRIGSVAEMYSLRIYAYRHHLHCVCVCVTHTCREQKKLSCRTFFRGRIRHLFGGIFLRTDRSLLRGHTSYTLFRRCTELFCEDVGPFCGYIGLFFGGILFCADTRLFCADILLTHTLISPYICTYIHLCMCVHTCRQQEKLSHMALVGWRIRLYCGDNPAMAIYLRMYIYLYACIDTCREQEKLSYRVLFWGRHTRFLFVDTQTLDSWFLDSWFPKKGSFLGNQESAIGFFFGESSI